MKKLVDAGVGEDNRPVVWVGHSMGGLLCKLILTKALHSDDPKMQNLAKNSKGIVFLGTPHRGSPIARWKQHMQLILSPSIEVNNRRIFQNYTLHKKKTKGKIFSNFIFYFFEFIGERIRRKFSRIITDT